MTSRPDKKAVKSNKAQSGLVFNSFSMENDALFRKQSFKLDTNTINVITGKNINSGNEENPNGVGKSYFFSAIPEFILDEPTVGSKKDKTRIGTKTLELTKDGVPYKFIRSFTAGKESIAVYKNGKDLAIRELKEAKAYINKVIGLNKAEIYTLLHLNFLTPHPLISGDTTARKAFFTSFFRQFDLLESYKLLVAEALAKAKIKSAQYVEVDKQKMALEARLPRESLSTLRKEKKALEEEFEELSAEFPVLMEACSLKEKLDSHKSRFRELLGLLDLSNSITEDDVSVRIKSVRSEGRALEQKIADIRSRAASIKQRRKLLVRIKELESELTDKEAVDISALKSKLSSIEERLSIISSEREEVARERARLEREKYELEHKVEHLESAVSGSCSYCGSTLTPKKSTREELSLRRKELVAVSKKLEVVGSKNSTEEEQALKKKASALRISLDEARQLEATRKELASLREALPEKVSEHAETEDTVRKQIEFIDETLANLDRLKPIVVLKEQWKNIPKMIRDKVSSQDLSQLRARMSTLNSCIAVVASKIASLEELASSIADLNARAAQLEDSAAELEELEVLNKAFSKRGAETLIIKSLCGQVQDQINKYAKLILPEDFVFSLDLSTDFSILVTRIADGKEKTSDVRKLSGAEAGLFALVLLISLLSFVPKSRRPNLLVMDEPMATMGEANEERFVKFLPTLRSVIPNIVVITPRQVDRFRDMDHALWQVEKKGLRSRIVRVER